MRSPIVAAWGWVGGWDEPNPRLVDPAAEVGGRADVGAHADDPRRHVRRFPDEVDEEAAERLLGRALAGVLSAEIVRDRGRRDRARGAALEPLAGDLAQLRLRRPGLERRERVVGVLPELRGQL